MGIASATPEIQFQVQYPCLRCGAALEAWTGTAAGWLRCPACGRAHQPPDFRRIEPPRAVVDPETVYIGPEFAAPSGIDRSGPRRPVGFSLKRVGLMLGFFLALGWLYDAYQGVAIVQAVCATILTVLMLAGLVSASRDR